MEHHFHLDSRAYSIDKPQVERERLQTERNFQVFTTDVNPFATSAELRDHISKRSLFGDGALFTLEPFYTALTKWIRSKKGHDKLFVYTSTQSCIRSDPFWERDRILGTLEKRIDLDLSPIRSRVYTIKSYSCRT